MSDIVRTHKGAVVVLDSAAHTHAGPTSVPVGVFMMRPTMKWKSPLNPAFPLTNFGFCSEFIAVSENDGKVSLVFFLTPA